MNTSSTYIPEDIVRHILSYSDEPILLGVSHSLEDIENDIISKDIYNPISRRSRMILARRSYFLGKEDISFSILKKMNNTGTVIPLDCIFFISRVSNDDIDTHIVHRLLEKIPYSDTRTYPLDTITSYVGYKGVQFNRRILLDNMLAKGASLRSIYLSLKNVDNETYKYLVNKINRKKLYPTLIISSAILLLIIL